MQGFVESPFSNSGGRYDSNFKWLIPAIENCPATSRAGAKIANAPENNYLDEPCAISSDPPYYDNIGYADLSDFFYIWLRKTAAKFHPDLFRRLVTEKNSELVATPYRHGGKQAAEDHFMKGMSKALAAMRNASKHQSPLAIYYAFKQSEINEGDLVSPGWAAFLQAAVDAAFRSMVRGQFGPSCPIA